MKTRIFLLAAFCMAAICAKAEKVITFNHPVVIYTAPVNFFQKNTTLEFVKVEFTDSATVITVKSNDPEKLTFNNTITLVSESKQNYNIHGFEQTGLSYRLFFDPMPATTKYFDFMNDEVSKNYFGIHDASYEMNFPKLSSYDTCSEIITNIDDFFKPGIATLIVKESKENKYKNFHDVTWTDIGIDNIGPGIIYNMSMDSLRSDSNNVETYIYNLPVSYPHFSNYVPSCINDANYYLEQGKTTEVNFDKNGRASFSKTSPMANLSYMLTATRLSFFEAAKTGDKALGYLAARFNLTKKEIHVLQRYFIDFDKLNNIVFLDDSVKENTYVKGNFVNKKLSDYTLLRKLRADDPAYLIMGGFRGRVLFGNGYDNIMTGLHANNKGELSLSWNDMTDAVMEADKQIFHTQEPSLFLQLWMFDSGELSHAISIYRTNPNDKKKLQVFNDFMTIHRKVITNPCLRNLFEQKYEELMKAKNQQKIEELNIFGDE